MCSAERRGLPGKARMRHDQHFVEELTTRVGAKTVGVMLPMATITPNPDQPRTAMGELKELVQSIEDKGILEPILVRGLSEDEAAPGDAEYVIISGERRYHAAARAGLDQIPAIVMEVDHDEALEIALIENLQRKDLTPFEEADGYRALSNVHGYTHEEIAKAIGKSRPSITEALSLLKLDPAVRSAAEALRIDSKSILLEVARRHRRDPEKQVQLLERVVSDRLKRQDLRDEGRQKPARSRRRARPAERAPVFTFKDPDKTFSLSVRFRKSTVEKDDLIAALERILAELRVSDHD